MTQELFAGEDNRVDESIGETTDRRGSVVMPFYLLCDVSGSMQRDIQELASAIEQLLRDIQKDPVVDDTTMLSIITFSGRATTIVPLSNPSDITLPKLSAGGGTSYSAAFEEYHRAFESDRAHLKAQGVKVFRPCVFFLTDGEPGDRGTYLETFRRLLAWDPGRKEGNRAYPYFVPFGFRDATKEVIQPLAYPNFGKAKGRWFLSRSTRIHEILQAVVDVLGKSVVSSGQSTSSGAPALALPTPPPGSDMAYGEAEDFV
jgi:hypothetical protein